MLTKVSLRSIKRSNLCPVEIVRDTCTFNQMSHTEITINKVVCAGMQDH